MRKKKDTSDHRLVCAYHKKRTVWGYSKTAKGWLCKDCCRDGMFREDIAKEVLADKEGDADGSDDQ